MPHISRLQNMLQSYNNWNSMVLIERQTYEQMEQNSSETNYAYMVKWSLTRVPRLQNGERIVSLINDAGKLQNSKIGLLFYTI